jgi:cytochrome c oxidase assembly protein subunit 15
MDAPKAFMRYVWVVLVTIFLVIVAGSVVRTTQSGMGCPDWPTCFGSVIPPTDSAQVVFQPNHNYKKGQFIIYNDSLKYARIKFTSGNNYNPENWKQYERHNNASFTVLTTWIEYLNRLLGALLGILIFIQVVWSLLLYKKLNSIVWLSFGLILLTGFQAWLGKTVVDSNLELIKITLHLFGALAMVFLSTYILFLVNGKRRVIASKSVVAANIILGILVLFQITMGTQVRGQVDALTELSSYIDRSGWVAQLNGWFYVHRSFALVVAVLVVYIYIKSKGDRQTEFLARRVLLIVISEIFVGLILVYLDFPKAAQPLHLLLSSVLVALVFNNILRLKSAKKL